MFDKKKAPKPVLGLREIGGLERAARMLEIIQYPRDYMKSLTLVVETLRPTLFGRDVKIEYWNAGRPTSVFQFILNDQARCEYQWTLSSKRKGTVMAVHCILNDWYIGHRKVGPITMLKGKDTFHPSWIFQV